MKRYWTTLICAALLAVGAVALHAANTSQLSIEPSEMKDGETKTFTDDGRTITVRREGNTTHVRIDNADKVESLTITREGNRIRIGHLGEGRNSIIVGPEGRRRIIIDGVPVDEFGKKFREFSKREMSTFYVCPKDKTTLRVPEAKEDQIFKCPLDGTTMEKKKGRGFTFFFDDDTFESNLL